MRREYRVHPLDFWLVFGLRMGARVGWDGKNEYVDLDLDVVPIRGPHGARIISDPYAPRMTFDAGLIPPDPPPRYDDVFEAGTKALDDD